MNLGYLFSAYLAIWICLGSYFIFLGSRQRAIRKDLERLEKELKSRKENPSR